MRFSTWLFAPLLSALFAFCFLSSVQARPRVLSKEERIANILAQKPLHTLALLAGAAAKPTPSPYPSDASDLGYTQRPPPVEHLDHLEADDGDNDKQV
ncbi:MAG: hypothetical protein Q9223_004964 [Gallowayella weberi]